MSQALRQMYAARAIQSNLASRIRCRPILSNPELRRQGGHRLIALEELLARRDAQLRRREDLRAAAAQRRARVRVATQDRRSSRRTADRDLAANRSPGHPQVAERCAHERRRRRPEDHRLPSGLIVRRAGPADARPLAALVHLVNSNSPPFQSVDDVACFLADPRNFQIVAEEENRLVSSMTMMYRPWNDSYELGRGLTRPDCHRRGLGALLMQRAVDSVCDAALGEVFIASSAPGVLSIPAPRSTRR